MNRKDFEIEICTRNIESALETERGGGEFNKETKLEKSINLPVLVVVDAAGNLFYHSSGYNIGTSEQILKIYNRLKD